MTSRLRAALYLRVSTAKQAEQDVSIPDQQRQGEAYCVSREFDLVETYVEPGASATTDRRPEFQRMIEAGTAKPPHFDVIVVHSFSRFFRDHFELEFYVRKLAKNGVRLVSITQEIGDDPVHVMMRQIMALFDEYQSKENAKHTLRAMKENARQGFWNGALPPIGYRLVTAEQRGARAKKKLEIDPLHADTVRLMYRLASEGAGEGPLGVKAIVNHLNENRIYTRSGNRWAVGAVHKILTRRSYIGTHEFNRRAKGGGRNTGDDVIEVAIPPLIDEVLFQKVQALLRSRNPGMINPAIVSSTTMLTGVLHCGHCGGSMTVMTGKSGAYRYYACGTRRRQGATACQGRAVPVDVLDELVIGKMEAMLLTPERLEEVLESVLDRRLQFVGERREQMVELNRKAADAQQRLSRLYEAIESGVANLDDSDLSDRIAALKATRDHARSEAERIRLLLDSSERKVVSPEMVAAFTAEARSRLRRSTGKFRRQYLQNFAQRVELHDRIVRIGGGKDQLLSSIISAGNVKAQKLVPSARAGWLPELDSNQRPLD